MIKALAILVKDLKAELDEQKKIVEEQKKEIEKLTREKTTPALTYASLVASSPKKSESDIVLLAKVHNELKEKKRIERNIVISGLPESTGKDENEIKEKENEIVEEILTELNVSLESALRHTRLRRRGARPEENAQPSLLLIELRSIDAQNVALANTRTLRDNPRFNKIYINPDKTFTERMSEAHLRNKRNELDSALPNVSNNGLIRYGIENENNKRFYYGIRVGHIVPLEPKNS
jgi:hypothetical protein